MHVSVFRQSHCLIAVTFAWRPYFWGEILCQRRDLITERVVVYGWILIKVDFRGRWKWENPANQHGKQSFGFAAHNREQFCWLYIVCREQSGRLLLLILLLLSSSACCCHDKGCSWQSLPLYVAVLLIRQLSILTVDVFPSFVILLFRDGASHLGLERFCHFKGVFWVSEVSVVFLLLHTSYGAEHVRSSVNGSVPALVSWHFKWFLQM